jgi:hypothetical protein
MKTTDLFPNYKLRDEFAALALKELMRASVKPELGPYADVYAKMAYNFADAMLKARAA